MATVTIDDETVKMVKKVLAYWSIIDDVDIGRLTQGTVVKQLALNELNKLEKKEKWGNNHA